MTFLINWVIAETYDLNTAAVMGWIFERCQRVVNEAGETSGRGWVHVSQEALAHRLHLTRQTVAKILKKLIDDRLIQAANSYTDEDGVTQYREFYPATKGIRGQTSCCKLISKKSRDRFARSKRRLIALASKEPLAKSHRCYTITYDGFIAMGLEPWEWNVRNHDALLSWGANEVVCSKMGINAAVVFQYLWFWAHNWKFEPKKEDSWRLWKAYTAASISHWVVFMSDDVILDALHRLLDAGLIMKRRDRWVTEWAIADAGYELMGKAVPCQSSSVGRGDSTLHPQPAGTPNANEEEARVEKTRQLLSVQLAYWQLEKRRARHKMRR